MTSPVLWLAAATLLIWVAFGVDAAWGRRRLLFLRDVPVPVGEMPRVSVVFGARDEARNIERAVRAMLELDYRRLEVVAIDDRSTDATGAILDRLAAEDARLQVEHIRELPDGWLGKNHALWRGATRSSGEFILFTDADVVLAPTVLSRAIGAMQSRRLDHVAAAPDVHVRGAGLQLFVAAFGLFFNAYFRPWRAADPRSRGYVGLGGFNLVRRSAYEAIGTHAALPMDLLDDMNLGRLLKRSGARQVCAIPGAMVRVEWYPTLREAIRGLEKNTMAGVHWSFALLVAGIAAQFVLAAWPYAAIFVTSGATRMLYIATVVVVVTIHLAMLRETSLPAWTPLLLPVGVVLLAWTCLRAAFLTYRRGGIEWRGSFYPLAKLR